MPKPLSLAGCLVPLLLCVSAVALADDPPKPTEEQTAKIKKVADEIAASRAIREANSVLISAIDLSRTRLQRNLELLDVAALVTELKAISSAESFGALQAQQTKLENARSALDQKKGLEPIPSEVKTALDNAATTLKENSGVIAEAVNSEKALREAVFRVHETVRRSLVEIAASLTTANALPETLYDKAPGTADEKVAVASGAAKKIGETWDKVLPDLVRKLRARQQWLTKTGDSEDALAVLKAQLKADTCRLAGVIAPMEKDACEKKRDDLLGAMMLTDKAPAYGPFFAKLSPLLTQAKQVTDWQREAVTEQILPALRDPVVGQLRGAPLLDLSSRLREAIEGLVTVVPQLVAVTLPKEVDPEGLSKAVAEDSLAAETLRRFDAALLDAIEPDASQFISDDVKLYYTSDLRRIMEFLRPDQVETKNSLSPAAEEAQRQRSDLTKLEADLEGKLADVNQLRFEAARLEEEQRQQQANLGGLHLKTSHLAARLQNLQRQKDQAQREYEAAKAKTDVNPHDAAALDALHKAEGRKTDVETRQTNVDKEYNSAKNETDSAEAKIEAANGQKDSLLQRLDTTRTALIEAAKSVASQRRQIKVAAQDEVLAFSQGRDTAPYLRALPRTGSSDPLRRVFLFGRPDRQTITVRGKPADVLKVREAIDIFDQPQPQARLTLWEMEVNVEKSQHMQYLPFYRHRDAEAINRAADVVDRHLLATRSRSDYTLTAFRDAVAGVAASVASGEDKNACGYGDEFESDRWVRFFDESVLKSLGLRDPQRTDLREIRGWLPDPRLTTTLGEAILSTVLACRKLKEDIYRQFVKKMERLGDKFAVTDRKGKVAHTARSAAIAARLKSCPLPRLAAKLGIDCECMTVATNAAQPELTLAIAGHLRRRASALLSERVASLNSTHAQFQQQKQSVFGLQAATPGINCGAPVGAKTDEVVECERLKVMLGRFSEGVNLLTNWLKDTANAESVGPAAAAYQAVPSAAPSDRSRAREAAGDQMLKDLTIAAEDDINESFIQPMLDELRADLATDRAIRVGLVNRTSVIALNRFVARVDAKSSAALTLGERIDILDSVSQIANVYLTAQTAGGLAALGTTKSLPHEPPPEIYGLNSSGTFQVTPVFDPSGQALHFTFDHVTANSLREPDGTTNPAFPKVERHTVNTEVQLSNLEVREISRFSGNAQLGLPTRYWGGIPILKDIPFVRPYVPLLGWFVRQEGRANSVTQSFIFGQTATYPTIQELVTLLSSSRNGE